MYLIIFLKNLLYVAVTISQLEITCSACKVLLKYLLHCLQIYTNVSNPNNTKIERYLKAIKCLCITSGQFSSFAIKALIHMLNTDSIVSQENGQTTRKYT